MRWNELKKRIEKERCFLNLLAGVIMCLIMLLFYKLNYYTPMMGDDYSYSYSFQTGERMTSVSQILESQIGHYHNTNGRSVTHALAQFFLLLGDPTFNYVNTVFFVLLLGLIYYHAFGTYRKFSISKFLMILILLFLSCPAFGQSFLWITGAANYQYGIFIVLLLLLPYRMAANKAEGKRYVFFLEIVAALLFGIAGIVAGWTNENTSVALIAMIIAYIAFFYITNRPIHLWCLSGLAGAVVGCLVMLMSPGAASRLNIAGGSGNFFSWIKRAIFITCNSVVILKWVLLILGGLLALYVVQRGEKWRVNYRKELRKLGIVLIYLLGLVGSIYSMVVSPQFPDRVWSGPVILSIILAGNLLSHVDLTGKQSRITQCICFTFAVVLCTATYINTFYELKNVNVQYENRHAEIMSAVTNGETKVVTPKIYGHSGYSCYAADGDLEFDSTKWPNTAIARYYGLDEVICNG